MIWIVGPLSEAKNFGQRPFLLKRRDERDAKKPK